MKFTVTLFFVVLTVVGATAEPKQKRLETDLPQVEVLRVLNGGTVPDVQRDRQGRIHLVFGKGNDAFYTQSAGDGKPFQEPVRLNRRVGTVTVGGERGPKLAIGKGGVILVAWQGHYANAGKNDGLTGGIWFTRSTDDGRTFAPERNLLDKAIGIDEPTLTADAEGNVAVVWLDGRMPETPENKVASPLFMTRSSDNGLTFSPNEALKTDFPGRGCSCCMLWARIVGSELTVAFRTGYRDIRDMYLLQGAKDSNAFQAHRVSVDNWKYTACPMSGPRFSVVPTVAITSVGQQPSSPRPLLLSWMSDGKVYWTHSEDGGKTFAPRISAPGTTGNYPMILSNLENQILLLWTRDEKIHWAVYTRNSLTSPPKLARTETAGPANGRPSAFLRPDGSFAILP